MKNVRLESEELTAAQTNPSRHQYLNLYAYFIKTKYKYEALATESSLKNMNILHVTKGRETNLKVPALILQAEVALTGSAAGKILTVRAVSTY